MAIKEPYLFVSIPADSVTSWQIWVVLPILFGRWSFIVSFNPAYWSRNGILVTSFYIWERLGWSLRNDKLQFDRLVFILECLFSSVCQTTHSKHKKSLAKIIHRPSNENGDVLKRVWQTEPAKIEGDRATGSSPLRP